MLKLITGGAGIYQLNTNEIVFITASNKFVSFLIEQEDILAIRDLLSLKSGMLNIIDCSHLTAGFKLFTGNNLKGHETIPLLRVLN